MTITEFSQMVEASEIKHGTSPAPICWTCPCGGTTSASQDKCCFCKKPRDESREQVGH